MQSATIAAQSQAWVLIEEKRLARQAAAYADLFKFLGSMRDWSSSVYQGSQGALAPPADFKQNLNGSPEVQMGWSPEVQGIFFRWKRELEAFFGAINKKKQYADSDEDPYLIEGVTRKELTQRLEDRRTSLLRIDEELRRQMYEELNAKPELNLRRA